jgi:hypothetical protein
VNLTRVRLSLCTTCRTYYDCCRHTALSLVQGSTPPPIFLAAQHGHLSIVCALLVCTPVDVHLRLVTAAASRTTHVCPARTLTVPGARVRSATAQRCSTPRAMPATVTFLDFFCATPR